MTPIDERQLVKGMDLCIERLKNAVSKMGQIRCALIKEKDPHRGADGEK